MELIELEPKHIPQLTHLLNRHLHLITPKLSLSEQMVQPVVFDGHHPWNIHYGSQPSGWKTQRYGIIEDGQLIAATQWDIPNEPQLSSTLYWIVSRPHHAPALNILIQHFIDRLQAVQCDEAHLTRFPFGVGWLGIPDTWTHIHRALTHADFWIHDTWLVWTGDITRIRSRHIAPPNNLKLTWDINPQKREWDLYLHQDNTEVGMCSAWGLPEIFDDTPAASQWLTIEYIDVKPAFRRQNIAKFMLQEQTRYHAKRSVQNFIFWIQQKNTPAINLARNMGFTQQFLSHDYNYTRETG